MNSFSRTVDLLHRAMDVTSLRYEVSAHNMSMSEVPSYKRQSVAFESELKRALDAGKDYRQVKPRLVTDYLTTSKANGNNVDAEQ
jgi:flagellar basal-body rod protein FlgB